MLAREATVHVTALNGLLANYGLGPATRVMAEGDEIRVETADGPYLVECYPADAMANPHFVAAATTWWSDQLTWIAPPERTVRGPMIDSLEGSSALIRPAPMGSRVHTSDRLDPKTLGGLMGDLHVAGSGFEEHSAHPLGLAWWREMAERLKPSLSEADAALLAEELRFQGLFRFHDLPGGLIHGHLVPGRLWMDSERVSGVTGFHRLATDSYLYDLATAANGWCCDAQGGLDQAATRALLRAYHAKRPLQPIERGAWPVMLRGAAFTAWLSALAVERDADIAARRTALVQRSAEQSALQALWV